MAIIEPHTGSIMKMEITAVPTTPNPRRKTLITLIVCTLIFILLPTPILPFTGMMYIGSVFLSGYVEIYPGEDFFRYLFLGIASLYTPVTLIALIAALGVYGLRRDQWARRLAFVPLMWIGLGIAEMLLNVILGTIYTNFFK
jgi:hypothetical protein